MPKTVNGKVDFVSLPLRAIVQLLPRCQ